jgi:hypothetical protein
MVQDRIYNYFERNPQLHVLFIFDPMDVMGSELVDATWDESLYVYKVFDGAWFNVKYAIEHDWKDKRVVLLFPDGTYPKEEEQQLRFPLMDMLKANMEYKEEDYASFMQQYNLPEVHRAFIRSNIAEIMSAKVQALISGYLTPELFSPEMVCRAFISCYMGEKKLLDWVGIIVRLIILCGGDDAKKRDDVFFRITKNAHVRKALDERLTQMCGATFNPNQELKMKEVAERMKYNCLTQTLVAHPADNYKAYKLTNSVALDLLNKTYESGMTDRATANRFPTALRRLAADIKEEVLIQVYGVDAAYFYMTEPLCWPILNEVVSHQLVADPTKASLRLRELSQKITSGEAIQGAIRFAGLMAQFYERLRQMDTFKLNTPQQYVDLYRKEFSIIDRLYRLALEAFYETNDMTDLSQSPLSRAKAQLDQEYAKVTNVLNLEWLTCVKESGNDFGSLSLSLQRDFYKNECDTTTKQAIIISDALRYEVAEELMQELAKEKHIATLDACLSTLPTETKYAKSVSLPHETLEWTEDGVTLDGEGLPLTEDRSAHLARYRQGAVCKTYDEVMSGDMATTREIFKHPLVYIYHNEIDEEGHTQSAQGHVKACRTAIDHLKVLVKRLHASWNVANVVVTADHGFLFNGITFEEKDKHSVTEECIEKKTRYYLTYSQASVEGMAKFSLSSVSGMKAPEGLMVAVPLGTNRLAAQGGYSFAHGGASLQEIIVPIIRSRLKRVDKTEKVGVALMNHNLTMVSSRLKVQLIQSEAVTMTVKGRCVVCALYQGDTAVTAEQTVALNSTDATNINNRVFDLSFTLNQPVSASLLQLRVFDEEDRLNPLIRETVKNSTMIDMDF